MTDSDLATARDMLPETPLTRRREQAWLDAG